MSAATQRTALAKLETLYFGVGYPEKWTDYPTPDIRADDAFGNLTLPGELHALGLKGRDAAFATEITYGTLRTLGVLDAVIDKCAAQGIATGTDIQQGASQGGADTQGETSRLESTPRVAAALAARGLRK